MRKLSLDNLLQKDVKIVEKKRIFFIVPLGIIVLAVIVGFIWNAGGVRGTFLNLSMDFTGGHVIQVNAGSSINSDNVQGHIDNIYDTLREARFNSAGELVDADYGGDYYNIRINERGITTMGDETEPTIRIQFRAPTGIAAAQVDAWMSNVTELLAEELNNMFGQARPVIQVSGNQVRATYDMPILAHVETGFFEQMLRDAGIGFVSGSIVAERVAGVYIDEAYFPGGFRRLVFEHTGTAPTIEQLTIYNPFFGQAVPHAEVSGTVSSALVISAIAAILWALVFMLAYIIIRFEFASGIAIIVSLIHDMIIMFAFITIFHIEISSTFIAIVITVLAYSINNSIIVFDRIRENRGAMYAKSKNVTSNEIANRSVVEVLGRNISTTVTTIIMIAMMAIVTAIGGITDMVAFALPITIGFLAGLFSSTCLAPSIWSIIRKNNLAPGRGFRRSNDENAPKTAVPLASPQPAMASVEE